MSIEKHTVLEETQEQMLYQIDDKPPLGVSIVLALQHILAAFAGIIAVPLVVAGALKLSVEETSMMVSASIFVAGVTTVLQSKGLGPIGSRVSGMMGTDFTFANPAISVGSRFGIAGIVGATIAGSLVEIVLSRFIKPLMKFFPPLITGTVVALIGITLLPVSMDWAAGGSGAKDYGSVENISIAFVMMVFTLLLNHYGKGLWSTASVFIGIIFGYILCVFLGKVDLSAVSDAAWFAFPKIFNYGVTFDFSAILSFVPAYVVSLIGTVGIMMAIGEASDTKMSSERAAQGIKTLATVKIGDRELLIISVAFALGIGVTVRPELVAGLPTPIQMVLSSGISTGTLAALVLNIALKEK
ncbi:xanthine permease [Streptococcus acidominimus]|uniref:Xanthine permease n=1 Tax=Streptococcus acidominimus TaxID=1326 RepID=A0A239WDP6_STRAI|nr:solute carrier family 23 protein [Streptococcus acidominimus]SNV32627.1 xanthine permease [Streptococcus acidominimus]